VRSGNSKQLTDWEKKSNREATEPRVFFLSLRYEGGPAASGSSEVSEVIVEERKQGRWLETEETIRNFHERSRRQEFVDHVIVLVIFGVS
jgi:hypothetical protein